MKEKLHFALLHICLFSIEERLQLIFIHIFYFNFKRFKLCIKLSHNKRTFKNVRNIYTYMNQLYLIQDFFIIILKITLAGVHALTRSQKRKGNAKYNFLLLFS